MYGVVREKPTVEDDGFVKPYYAPVLSNIFYVATRESMRERLRWLIENHGDEVLRKVELRKSKLLEAVGELVIEDRVVLQGKEESEGLAVQKIVDFVDNTHYPNRYIIDSVLELEGKLREEKRRNITDFERGAFIDEDSAILIINTEPGNEKPKPERVLELMGENPEEWRLIREYPFLHKDREIGWAGLFLRKGVDLDGAVVFPRVAVTYRKDIFEVGLEANLVVRSAGEEGDSEVAVIPVFPKPELEGHSALLALFKGGNHINNPDVPFILITLGVVEFTPLIVWQMLECRGIKSKFSFGKLVFPSTVMEWLSPRYVVFESVVRVDYFFGMGGITSDYEEWNTITKQGTPYFWGSGSYYFASAMKVIQEELSGEEG